MNACSKTEWIMTVRGVHALIGRDIWRRRVTSSVECASLTMINAFLLWPNYWHKPTNAGSTNGKSRFSSNTSSASLSHFCSETSLLISMPEYMCSILSLFYKPCERKCILQSLCHGNCFSKIKKILLNYYIKLLNLIKTNIQHSFSHHMSTIIVLGALSFAPYELALKYV